jgi:hypothetical protein
MELQSIIQQYKTPFLEKHGNSLLPSQWLASMPCNVAAHSTPVSFICNARNVSKAIGIRCHVDIEVVQNAKTMRSAC